MPINLSPAAKRRSRPARGRDGAVVRRAPCAPAWPLAALLAAMMAFFAVVAPSALRAEEPAAGTMPPPAAPPVEVTPPPAAAGPPPAAGAPAGAPAEPAKVNVRLAFDGDETFAVFRRGVVDLRTGKEVPPGLANVLGADAPLRIGWETAHFDAIQAMGGDPRLPTRVQRAMLQSQYFTATGDAKFAYASGRQIVYDVTGTPAVNLVLYDQESGVEAQSIPQSPCPWEAFPLAHDPVAVGEQWTATPFPPWGGFLDLATSKVGSVAVTLAAVRPDGVGEVVVACGRFLVTGLRPFSVDAAAAEGEARILYDTNARRLLSSRLDGKFLLRAGGEWLEAGRMTVESRFLYPGKDVSTPSPATDLEALHLQLAAMAYRPEAAPAVRVDAAVVECTRVMWPANDYQPRRPTEGGCRVTLRARWKEVPALCALHGPLLDVAVDDTGRDLLLPPARRRIGPGVALDDPSLGRLADGVTFPVALAEPAAGAKKIARLAGTVWLGLAGEVGECRAPLGGGVRRSTVLLPRGVGTVEPGQQFVKVTVVNSLDPVGPISIEAPTGLPGGESFEVFRGPFAREASFRFSAGLPGGAVVVAPYYGRVTPVAVRFEITDLDLP
ncbi:MAG: hypothetical protein HY719_12980 [Planctomycetes bacterium]|nr:hypothetical protein [Planctomycetota bacterium]